MRYINAFKPIRKNQPIQYSDKILEAVLNPKIRGLCINMNNGYDWVDMKYLFILVLIKRGQVSAIKSGQDLLACTQYREALTSNSFVNVILECRMPTDKTKKPTAYASALRIKKAQGILLAHVQQYRLGA